MFLLQLIMTRDRLNTTFIRHARHLQRFSTRVSTGKFTCLFFRRQQQKMRPKNDDDFNFVMTLDLFACVAMR